MAATAQPAKAPAAEDKLYRVALREALNEEMERDAVELLLCFDCGRHQPLSARSSGRSAHSPAYVYL